MLIDKFKNTLKKYNLINKNDFLVVGVSGGPDSVVLLYLLNSLRVELKLSLHVAHLDHMLRRPSRRDAEFVKGLAERLGLPVTIARVNVKELAAKGSLEEIARKARFDFLFKVAKSVKARKIVLGHNLDDQAETVLMRMIRGTGLHGLSGISPRREMSGYCIVRPLIEISRREIELLLKKKKIKVCTDETNLKDIYFRNKLRNRLLPLLAKEYNANIKEVLSNLAFNVGYDYDYLNQAAAKMAARLGKRIRLSEFNRLHPAIQRLVLRLNIARVKGDMRRLTFQHINEINDLISNRPADSIVDLPGEVSVVKKNGVLFFYRRRGL